ncbi:MAG: hypothetical protein WCO66_03740 [Candidatus Absconditabacteria bacterium]
MKNLVIIIGILVIFSSCAKEQIVHNRFVVLGDYTFEVLSGPNEDGDMKVKIVNRKDSLFSYLEHYNDLYAIKRTAYEGLCSTDIAFEFAEKTISLHKNSGLSIYPKSRKMKRGIDFKITDVMAFDAPIEPSKGNVFESATNFFNIY